jgi:hypothetical protein
VVECKESGGKKMLHNLVGELVDWVYDTTNNYDMAISSSKYLMAQGGLTFEESIPDPSSALEHPYFWTQLVKEIDDCG